MLLMMKTNGDVVVDVLKKLVKYATWFAESTTMWGYDPTDEELRGNEATVVMSETRKNTAPENPLAQITLDADSESAS